MDSEPLPSSPYVRLTVDQLAQLIDLLVNSQSQTFSSELPNRLLDTRFKQANAAVTASVVIPADSTRWGLVIGGGNTNPMRIGLDGTITGTVGILIPTSSQPLEWIGNIWRPIVQREIWIISLAAPQVVSWIEIFQAGMR